MHFHLFNSVYLSPSYSFQDNNDYILIDPQHKNLNENIVDNKSYSDLTTLLTEKFANDLEQFWLSLRAKKDNFYVYCDSNTFCQLQIQYWKNILPNLSQDFAYILHNLSVTDKNMKSTSLYISPQNYYYKNRGLFERLSADNFAKIYNHSAESAALKSVPVENIGFEYQLATYLFHNKKALKGSVLEKVKKITYDNWMHELDLLKLFMFNAAFDLNTLLPDGHKIDYSNPCTVELQMRNNFYLSWCFDTTLETTSGAMVDSQRIHYLKENYPVEIFKVLYNNFYNAWGTSENMDELTAMIYEEKFEELLDRDIARKLGCVYSNNKFFRKMDQLVVSLIYKSYREKDLNTLEKMSLL